MAYYGINSGSLSAGAEMTRFPWVEIVPSITGASVYGGEGNDLLSFAAVGTTGIFSARNCCGWQPAEEVSGTLSGVLTTWRCNRIPV